MNRRELQNQLLELIDSNKRIAIQWGTGLGKSKASIDLANYIQDKEKEGNIKVLIVVAETPHKSNWEQELNKWNIKTNDVTIECYASLKKYNNSFWDLIIFDEAHHLGTDLKLDILSTMISDYVILLSATLPDHILQAIEGIFGKFSVSKVTLKQAIEWGILPKPKVFLIPLTLDNTTNNCIITEEWGTKNKRKFITCTYYERWNYLANRTKYPNITLQISCTQKQKYEYLTEQFEYWRKRFLRTRNEAIKNKWLQTGSKRKRFLGECKTEEVKVLLNKIKDKRFICFCSSIEQAESFNKHNAIHSKKDNSLEIISDFNNKIIDSLYAVNMLQEGQNLKDIEVGIIVQLDGQERAFVQKFGRSLRAEDPIQFVFYYKDTRDTEYLNNVIEGIDNEYIIEIDNLTDFEL